MIVSPCPGLLPQVKKHELETLVEKIGDIL
jgi:hypothetical protein